MPVPSKPYTFSSGTTIDHTQVNSDFDTLYTALNAGLDAENIASTTNDKLGLSTAATVRRGKANIATSQNTTSTSYVTLTTPDRVQNIVLPTDGLIAVAYQAIWQNTVAANARAAIFIGANQLKVQDGSAAAPIVQQANGPTTTGVPAPLASYNSGLSGQGNTFAAMTEVTTGQAVANSTIAGSGGPVYIFAAAGTYDVSVQFKNNAAGTLTVSNRHLWVWTIGF